VNDGVAFKTTDGPANKNKGKHKKATCYKCKKQDHYVNECDKDDTTTKMSNKKGYNFMNQGHFSDIEEGCTDGNSMYEEMESSDNEYRFVFLQHDFVCSIQDKPAIPKAWILLDSLSTVVAFSNAKLLTNIGDKRRNLILYCNMSKAIITKKGDLKGSGTTVLIQHIVTVFIETSSN